jgi:UDP-2-acetamido-3-amino-2,3-dideoxy-glucuronate N-acetyltransferase
MVVNVHPQAFVESDHVGSHTAVGAFTHVGETAEVGRNCRIGEHCVIECYARLGRDVIVGPGAIVVAGVTLEDGVHVGPRVTFSNDSRWRPARHLPDPEPTLVREGAALGAGVTLCPGVTVGRYAVIAPGSLVATDVPDFARAGGAPAVQVGWVCRCGAPLDVAGDAGEAGCGCGLRYLLAAGRLSEAEA